MEYEQISIFDFIGDSGQRIFKFQKPIRVIEAFGGIGSQSMAFEKMHKINPNFEWETWKLIEFDKYACESYNAIHNTNYKPTDIRDIHAKDLEIVDTDKYDYIFFYSFPCQDISVAGLGKGFNKQNQRQNATRSGLLWEVERLITECQALMMADVRYGMPVCLVMENVPNIHGQKNIKDFEEWLRFLQDKGYSNFWDDMNAAKFGIPQSRNRCFCVSLFGNWTYKFPKEIPLEKKLKDILEEDVDERYYLNSEKAKDLIEKLILNGKIVDECISTEDKKTLGD